MSDKRVILFDFDGTLVDTRRDLASAVNHLRRDLGLHELSVAEVLKHVGLGANHLLAYAVPEAAGEDQTKLRDRFRECYAAHMLDTAVLYPTVRETLEVLKERGCLLGVNTAKPSFAARKILQKLDIEHFFGDAVIAGGDSPEMKPSKVPALLCAAKLGATLGPDDWMVGDNWTDVECGYNAGIKSAFCEFGFGSLNASVPTVRLRQMSDLIPAIKW